DRSDHSAGPRALPQHAGEVRRPPQGAGACHRHRSLSRRRAAVCRRADHNDQASRCPPNGNRRIACLWTTTDGGWRQGLTSGGMQRTVSVVAAASGAAADVRLDACRTVGEVLPALRRLTGSAASLITRAGIALEPGLPVAHLRDGDLLVLTDA